MSDLSDTWVEFWCEAFRDIPQFDNHLPAPFDPVRLRYHTDGNIGVVDFFSNGTFMLTSVMLLGQDPDEGENLIKSLAELAREQQKQAGFKVTNYQEAINATERPLHIIFLRSYERDPMVPELVNHLAGAFMQRFEI